MPEVYRKIENRILSLKQKEELWKSRYKEIAKELKALVESNSQKMKSMESAIEGFEERIKAMESESKRAGKKSEETLRLADRKAAEMTELSKTMSQDIGEKDKEIKRLKADVISQVNSMIEKHEKTFGNVIEKINNAARSMENGLQNGESVYEKMETVKRYMENYRPPSPQIMVQPRRPVPQDESDIPRIHFVSPSPQPILQEQSPPRFEPGMPFSFESAPVSSPPNALRMAPGSFGRRDIDFDDDLDDDMDVDDIISGNMKEATGNRKGVTGDMKGFKSSVESMNSNFSGITDKLASIEDKMAKMQAQKNPSMERLDDKIRMYSDSIIGMQSRMDTVEKALRDGMTPMMETMKMMADAVKALKDDARPGPSVRKPIPPASYTPSQHKIIQAPSRKHQNPLKEGGML